MSQQNDGSEKPSSFKVVDRRAFTSDGEMRPDASPVAPHTAAATQPTSPAATHATTEPSTPLHTDTAGKSTQDAAPKAPPPQLQFAHFLLSLGGSAQMAMGLVPHPHTGLVTKDLPGARGTIDLLAMLEQKTQGNLTPDEAQLLQELLYALRLQFVEVTKNPSAPATAT